MDVQVADSGPCRRTLTIKIPATQVAQHLDRMFKAAAHKVDIKGFRRGKVPRRVLEQKFGPQIQAEAKEQLVRSSIADACREHEIVMIGRARLEGLSEDPLGPDRDVEFQVHLDVKPEIALGELTGIEIRAEPTAVTDEDLQHALQDLAGQKRTLGAVDEPIAEGDFARVDMTFATENGTEVSKRDGVQINPGIPIAGTDPTAFRDQLIGAKAGDSVTFELTFPDTFDKEAVRGQKGTVTVLIHEVMRVKDAPIDDELAKAYEFDSLDALREELQKQIGAQKVESEKIRQSDLLLQMVANEHQFEVPESFVEDEQRYALEQFEKRLRDAGLGDDEVTAKLAEAQQPSREDAERRVRMFFLIDAIARKQDIRVMDRDVEAEIQHIAARHDATVDQVRAHYGEDPNASQLRLMLLERKVREFLREHAAITDN